MATLEKIRSKAGLLVTIVGVALFAFIIGDFLNSGSTYFRQSQELVIDVNGSEMKIQEYQARVDEMAEMYKMQNGASSLPEEYMTQIRQSVFDGFVQEVILDEETEKLGMTVGPEELFDMVQGENISPVIMQQFTNPETRTFDKTYLLNFLKQINDNTTNYTAEQRAEIDKAKAFWLFLERNIKRQRLEQKYMSLISKAVSANKLDAKDAFDGGAESSDIVYAMQAYSTIPDSTITVSESELKKLYEQRKETLKQKEEKVIKYIAADIRPSKEDYDKASADIEAIKEELKSNENVADVVNDNSEVPYMDAFFAQSALDAEMGKFAETALVGDIYGPVFENDKYRMFKLVNKVYAPDSVKVSHIMLAGKTDDEIKHLADSLMSVLDKGGDFAELAKQYSVDQSAANGGELGWFTEATALRGINEDFKNAIFSAQFNKVSVVKSLYGTHLVKVTDKTDNVYKYKIADIEMTVSPSSSTYSKIYNDLNKFVADNAELLSEKEGIEDVAKEAGYAVNSRATISAGDQTLGSIRNSRQVIRWAFQGSKGDVSEIFECDDKFVVAVVLGTIKEGYRPLRSAAPMLEADLKAEKKGDKIVEELTSKNLTSLDAYAKAMGASVDSVKFVNFGTRRLAGVGLEPRLSAAVSMAKENQLSQPVKGTNGVYVFTVVQRTKEDKEFDEAAVVQNLNASNMYRFGFQSIQSLINKSEIEDNRIRFY